MGIPRFVSALVVGVISVAAFGDVAGVAVTGGRIAGETDRAVRSYKGIPYAAPPVGALRWRAPQPVVPWEGVRDCRNFEAKCPQTPYPEGSFYARALGAYEVGKGTQEDIAALYGVSLRTFQRWWAQYRRTGSTHPKKRGHRQAAYTGKKLKRLDRIVQKHPDATLDELRALSGKSCSIMAVQRAVIRLGYRLKKNAIGQRTKST